MRGSDPGGFMDFFDRELAGPLPLLTPAVGSPGAATQVPAAAS
jgi:hypothetical protein